MPKHVAHLKTAKDQGVTITVGGPLMADDDKTSIGSLMVLDVADRATAEKFNKADPFHKNGSWGQGRHPALRSPDVKRPHSPTKSLIAARKACGCSSGGQWPQPGNST
jgi:uncharacterized protein YciI